MTYLKGVDISHHNGEDVVNKILNNDKAIDFFIVKATEGRTYVDPKCNANCEDVLNNYKLLGMYHFARPDNGNTPKQEAAHFVSQFSHYLGEAIPVLDWEGKALDYPVKWPLDWMKNVYEMTGVKPVLYVQQSAVKRMGAIKDFDCGLWVARYNKDKKLGDVAPWNAWTIWQYDDGRFFPGKYDKNYFNGSKSQFMAYCKSALSDEKVEGKCTCGCEYCN